MTKEMGKACFIFFQISQNVLCPRCFYARDSTSLSYVRRFSYFKFLHEYPGWKDLIIRYKFTIIIIIIKKKERKQIDILFGENKSEFLSMIILPRHFAPLFPPGIYTFRSFLKRVSTRRFGIFQVGPSNVRKMPGCLAVRRIDEHGSV